MLAIFATSEAGRQLSRALADPATYKVSLEQRGESSVALKVNEKVWTPSLTTYPCIHARTKVDVGNSRTCTNCGEHWY